MNNRPRQWGATPWTREPIPKPVSTGCAHPVAIIGAGLTGASTAYHLAKRGIFATIYEAGRVGEGASGRTGGLVLEGTAAGPLDEVSSCISELQNLVNAEEIDCGLHLPGCREIGHGEKAGKPLLPWKDNGQPMHVEGTVRGGVVEPARLLTGILKAAIRLGAELREHSPAVRITAEPAPAVEFASETLHPEYAIVAVNAWLASLIPPRKAALRSSLTFACATQPLDDATLDATGLGAGVPFYTADLPYLWGRTMDDRRAIFGSGLVFGPPSALEATDVSKGNSRAALNQIHERVRRLHPKLNNIGFSASWGGPIAFTDDFIPFLSRHPKCRNTIVAGAYSGHGVALSVRAGQLIARAIAEDAELPGWGALDRKPHNSRMNWR